MKNLISNIFLPLALLLPSGLAQSIYEPYTFTTFVGYPGQGSADGTGPAAQFHSPAGTALDGSGNIYVADSQNNVIRKITPAGVVSTLAGDASVNPQFGIPVGGYRDGVGAQARFNYPSGVAVDKGGNVFVADSGNQVIRKITPAGVVSTLAGNTATNQFGAIAGGYADGTGSQALFLDPEGVATDDSGNVYVADSSNNAIRKITPGGVVTTLAGFPHFDSGGEPIGGSIDGQGKAARFNSPIALAVDKAGTVYVADGDNATIRKITPQGLVSTLAGLAGATGSLDGKGTAARFGYPAGIAVDDAGNVMVADLDNGTVRKVTSSGVVTTLAGLAGQKGSVDGTGNAARFDSPWGLSATGAGDCYVSDQTLNVIRKVTVSGVATTVAGRAGSAGSEDGVTSNARFSNPLGLAVDVGGNLIVADTENQTIRKVTPGGVVTTLAGAAGKLGSTDGTGDQARFHFPRGLAIDTSGTIYVADSGNNTIRAVSSGGVVTTLAGHAGAAGPTDGVGNAALFNFPVGLALSPDGNLYVADANNGTIRKVTLAGSVTTFAGKAGVARAGSVDGTGSNARFTNPSGIAVDGAGILHVADTGNNTIRTITPAGVVTTLAGSTGARQSGSADGVGSNAQFHSPAGVAVDRFGNVFVADSLNQTIRKITPAGSVTTIGGNSSILDGTGAVAGYWADGTGIRAGFNGPIGVAVDAAGDVYVADSHNNLIRKGFTGQAVLKIIDSGPAFGFSGAAFGFELTGPSGRSVVVEASLDLVSWAPIWTNTFAATLTFRDTSSGVHAKRFYRLRTP